MVLAFSVYFIIYYIFTVVTFLLSITLPFQWFWEQLWAFLWPILVAMVSISLIEMIVQLTIVNHVLTDARSVVYPRWYSMADLWFSFTGVIVGIVRLFTRTFSPLSLRFPCRPPACV